MGHLHGRQKLSVFTERRDFKFNSFGKLPNELNFSQNQQAPVKLRVDGKHLTKTTKCVICGAMCLIILPAKIEIRNRIGVQNQTVFVSRVNAPLEIALKGPPFSVLSRPFKLRRKTLFCILLIFDF
jgi:hypothetical protein